MRVPLGREDDGTGDDRESLQAHPYEEMSHRLALVKRYELQAHTSGGKKGFSSNVSKLSVLRL